MTLFIGFCPFLHPFFIINCLLSIIHCPFNLIPCYFIVWRYVRHYFAGRPAIGRYGQCRLGAADPLVRRVQCFGRHIVAFGRAARWVLRYCHHCLRQCFYILRRSSSPLPCLAALRCGATGGRQAGWYCRQVVAGCRKKSADGPIKSAHRRTKCLYLPFLGGPSWYKWGLNGLKGCYTLKAVKKHPRFNPLLSIYSFGIIGLRSTIWHFFNNIKMYTCTFFTRGYSKLHKNGCLSDKRKVDC